MASQLCALLAVVALSIPATIHGASVDPRSQFTYLGSFERITVKADGGSAVTNSFYYLSHNNAEWETAQADCEDALDGDLVSLETQDEVDALQKQLEESGDASTLFWSGGKYDSGSKKFVWVSGSEFGADAPWEAGQPGLSTRMSRVSIRTVEGLQLRSRFNTETARYICELS